MRIVEEYNDSTISEVIAVTDAVYLKNYTIKIIFSDQLERAVDFKPFLFKSLHPSISKYLDKNLFKSFEIKDGNLNWNDYDLIFPVYDLYEGNI